MPVSMIAMSASTRTSSTPSIPISRLSSAKIRAIPVGTVWPTAYTFWSASTYATAGWACRPARAAAGISAANPFTAWR